MRFPSTQWQCVLWACSDPSSYHGERSLGLLKERFRQQGDVHALGDGDRASVQVSDDHIQLHKTNPWKHTVDKSVIHELTAARVRQTHRQTEDSGLRQQLLIKLSSNNRTRIHVWLQAAGKAAHTITSEPWPRPPLVHWWGVGVTTVQNTASPCCMKQWLGQNCAVLRHAAEYTQSSLHNSSDFNKIQANYFLWSRDLDTNYCRLCWFHLSWQSCVRTYRGKQVSDDTRRLQGQL